MAIKKAVQDQPVQIKRLERATIIVPIVGITPLIVHRFDEKSKKMMLDKMQARIKARAPKEARDPDADYERSRYRLSDGRDGFPANGFKHALVDAARYVDSVTMTALRVMTFVQGEGFDQLVHIIGEPKMREDAVRVGMGTADLRYRAMYDPWSAELTVSYLPSQIDAESIVNLIDASGNGGVGEWRPSKGGTYGRFEVDASRMMGVTS